MVVLLRLVGGTYTSQMRSRTVPPGGVHEPRCERNAFGQYRYPVERWWETIRADSASRSSSVAA